jgi:hypothetical protein
MITPLIYFLSTAVMKKVLLLCSAFLLFCFSFSFADSSIVIKKITGLREAWWEINISYPQIWLAKIDRKIRDHITKVSRNYSLWYADLSGSDSFGISEASLIIDCKVVTDTDYFYSVLCDDYMYVGWAHGQASISAYNFNKKTQKIIWIDSLLSKWRLKLLSKNLYNHFVLKLQATDESSQQWIRDGLDPNFVINYNNNPKYPVNYRDFTLLATWSSIYGMNFYFAPYEISSWAAGTQRVGVTYPGLRIRK